MKASILSALWIGFGDRLVRDPKGLAIKSPAVGGVGGVKKKQIKGICQVGFVARREGRDVVGDITRSRPRQGTPTAPSGAPELNPVFVTRGKLSEELSEGREPGLAAGPLLLPKQRTQRPGAEGRLRVRAPSGPQSLTPPEPRPHCVPLTPCPVPDQVRRRPCGDQRPIPKATRRRLTGTPG